jgi:hypothetical protein
MQIQAVTVWAIALRHLPNITDVSDKLSTAIFMTSVFLPLKWRTKTHNTVSCAEDQSLNRKKFEDFHPVGYNAV